MKKFAFFFIVLSFVLSACDGIRIVPTNPFTGAIETNLGTATSPQATGTVTSLSSRVYKINVNNIPSTDDVVYFETDRSDVELVLYTVSNGLAKEQRVSTNANVFGVPSAIPHTSSLESQAIIPTPKIDSCRGSCIIIKKGQGTVYLRVRAKTSTPVNYKLFIFSDKYRDSSEPANEPVGGKCVFSTSNLIHSAAIVITPKEPYALETVSDVDCFSSNARTNAITLNAGSGLTFNLKAQILDRSGNLLKFRDGRDAILYVGPNHSTTATASATFPSEFILRVSSADGRAAPAAHSQYTVTFGN